MLDFQCTQFYFIDKYLLSYSTLISPDEPDVHHMTSQFVSILIDFTQISAPFFQSCFQFFITLYLWSKRMVKGSVPDFQDFLPLWLE